MAYPDYLESSCSFSDDSVDLMMDFEEFEDFEGFEDYVIEYNEDTGM